MTTNVSPGIIEQLSEEPGPILVWNGNGGVTIGDDDVWFIDPKGAPVEGDWGVCYTSKEAAILGSARFGSIPNPVQETLDKVLAVVRLYGFDWLLLVDEHWCVVDKWRVQ